MQTFLPFPDFAESAAVLDRQRLGKQRVETMQIMEALLFPEQAPKSIVGHPATKMWRGYEYGLLRYQWSICNEWTGRGYKDTCRVKTNDLFLRARSLTESAESPFWMGDERVHGGHRAMLLYKNLEHYGPLFGPDEEPAVVVPGEPMPYFWPVQ